MRIPRIYHPELITPGGEIALSDDAANHVGRVLRMGAGQAIQLFDGSNQIFDAEITRADKKSVHVKVLRGDVDDRESPLHIHLGQVMSRGEKMEFTIQKSIELGVSLITPLFSERMTARYQFTDILLGPRVLRTETTALTAITALQVRFGDLG